MTLLLILWSFTKVGILGYGGGPSMVPLVKAEVVDGYRWMTATEFTDALAMGYALPGPIATKIAAVVGYKIMGIPGAIAALTGMVLPSLILVFMLFRIANAISPELVEAVLKGIRPVVVALLVWAAWDVTPGSITSVTTGLIAVVTFAILIFTKIHPAFLIVAAGLLGYYLFRPPAA